MRIWILAFVSAVLAAACGIAPRSEVHGRVVLTLLHTSDLHSRLFPSRMRVGRFDAEHGMGEEGKIVAVGGFSRLASIVRRERERADRVLVLDSGDALVGGSAYRVFGGEPEIRALSALGADAEAVGNHDLDHGAAALAEAHRRWGTFPLLAANYLAEPGEGGTPLSGVVTRSTVLEARGLRIAVIGVGNVATVPEALDRPSSLGIIALETVDSVQREIDFARGSADLVALLTHLGLDEDEALVRGISGVDVVLGGHDHLALEAPRVVLDRKGERVLIVRSGAYGRWVGRLDLILSDEQSEDRFEVAGHRFVLIPVTEREAEDAEMAELLEPYRALLERRIAASEVVTNLADDLSRSTLAQIAAEALADRAEADVAILGTSTARAELLEGAVTRAEVEEAFPFDDPVVSAAIPASELRSMLDRAAESAVARACAARVVLAGATATLRCGDCGGSTCVEKLAFDQQPSAMLEVASTRYEVGVLGSAGAFGTRGRELGPLREVVERRLAAHPDLEAARDSRVRMVTP